MSKKQNTQVQQSANIEKTTERKPRKPAKPITPVTVDELLKMAGEHGVQPDPSVKSWHALKTNRKAIYIAKSKRGVMRFHLSGAEAPKHRAIEALSPEQAKELQLGKVRGVVECRNLERRDILESFKACLRVLTAEDAGFKFRGKEVREEATEQATTESK